MRSERQALADIAKLCDDGNATWSVNNSEYPYVQVGLEPITVGPMMTVTEKIRSVLADVQPEPAPAGGTIDRDALGDRERGWLIDVASEGVALLEQWSAEEEREDPESADGLRYGVRADCGRRAIERVRAGALVRPVGGTIDRDALIDIIEQAFFEDGVALTSAHLAADRILALLRPVEGVMLTPDERAAISSAGSSHPFSLHRPNAAAALRALADRLKAAS